MIGGPGRSAPIWRWAGLLGLMLLAACTTNGPLPTGEQGGDSRLPMRTVDVLYVTDRAEATAPDGSLTYSSKRSKAMSFGSVVLAEDGASGPAGKSLSVLRVTETGQFPPTPYLMDVVQGGVRREPAVIAKHEQATQALRAEVSRQLGKAKRKEVVFFIHGYANEFDDAVETTGSLCRSLHREFVCVALTWPAGGSGGAFMGYNIDRESGEFAVADMKKAIRIIATTPGVEKVHIIAHSRGTDVLTSVLQQLAIETYVGRSSLWERFKIRNVVLFAADIDLDVAKSKLFGLGSDPDLPVGTSADPGGVVRQGFFHLTVYSSPKDRALGISGRIFGSQARLGQLSLPKLGANKPFEQLKDSQLADLIDFIEYDGNAGWIGHSYFLTDPAVNADLVALIRDDLKTGDPGRPVVEIRRPFWRVVSRPAGAVTSALPPG